MLWCYGAFFFNDTATTEIYTLSLHDALPILRWVRLPRGAAWISISLSSGSSSLPSRTSHSPPPNSVWNTVRKFSRTFARSEEHTSELQSQSNLVCRLLLGKKTKMRDRLSRPL